MILNEKEFTMARELASELVVVQKKKTKENVIQSIKTLKEALTDLLIEIKNNVMNLWGAVKNTEAMTYDVKKRDFYNWHVPLDTTLASQVKIPNIHTPKIRSSI